MNTPSEKMDQFNKLTSNLLDRLHDNFPVALDIVISDYSYLDTAENSPIFFATVRFLNKEGYLSYSTAVYGGFVDVVLTAKGLALLNSKPSSISKADSLINVIKNAVRVGTADSYRTCVKELTKMSISSAAEYMAKE